MTMWRRCRPYPLLVLAMGTPARADDPALAPGRDPAGTAVVVLADGFDYTRPEVAHVLARDGEGEAVAWDAVDGDHRPFARDGRGTDLALAAAARGGVRVVMVRVAPRDAASLAQGLAFAAATPARIVLVELDDEAKAGLDVLKAAVQRFDKVMIVGAVPSLGADALTESESLPSLVLIDGGDGGRAAADTIARALGCGQAALTGESGADLKQAFLARLKERASPGCEPESGTKDQER